MNTIVKQLSEIEEASQAIVAKAEEQKETLRQEMENKRNEFDTKLQADTEKRINDMDAEMKASLNQQTAKMREENQHMLDRLQMDYDNNHEKYAQEIVSRITAPHLTDKQV